MRVSLAVLAFTRGDPFAARFLEKFRDLAQVCEAEYVIAGDRAAGFEMAQRFADRAIPVETSGIQESHIAQVARQIEADWILKLDDDESISSALWQWLVAGGWQQGERNVYSFPTAWLWGDEGHFITSFPFWPDPHARLMKRECFFDWGTGMHAGNPHGVGWIVHAALWHHKFLVKDMPERLAVARRYDALRPGAGTGPYYGKFTLPEVFCRELVVREVGDGLVKLDEWVGTGEKVALW